MLASVLVELPVCTSVKQIAMQSSQTTHGFQRRVNYSWVSLCSEVKGMSLFNLSPSDMSFFLSSLPRASSSFSTLSSSFLTLCSVVPGMSDSMPAADASIKSLKCGCDNNACMPQRYINAAGAEWIDRNSSQRRPCNMRSDYELWNRMPASGNGLPTNGIKCMKLAWPRQ